MAIPGRRRLPLVLALAAGALLAACNVTFSQIDFERIESPASSSLTGPRYAGGSVYPPVGW